MSGVGLKKCLQPADAQRAAWNIDAKVSEYAIFSRNLINLVGGQERVAADQEKSKSFVSIVVISGLRLVLEVCIIMFAGQTWLKVDGLC